MVKRELKPCKVCLTGGNLAQLKKGNATLLKHAQLDQSKGTVTLYLRPRVANKLHKAFAKDKGVKLQMVPEEFKKSFEGGFVDGAGFPDDVLLASKLGNAPALAVEIAKIAKKKGGKINYKKSIKPVLGPVLKNVAKKAIVAAASNAAAAAATASGNPEFAPAAAALGAQVANQYADKGATELGKATGGWGVGDVEHVRKKPASHGLNFIDPSSPAWNPGPGLKDNSDSRPVARVAREASIRSGGSFKPAGGYGLHPAMHPTRDHTDLRNLRL